MKTALLCLKNNSFDLSDIFSVTSVFSKGGIELDSVEVLRAGDEIRFKKRLSEYKDTFDLLVFLDESESVKIKNIVAEVLETSLIENDNAQKFISKMETTINESISKDYALLPLEASVIPNLNGKYQGFILDKEDFTVAGFPYSFLQFKSMMEEYLLPFVEKKFFIKQNKMILKYFGDKDKLNTVLEMAKKNSDYNYLYNVIGNYGDYTINLIFNDSDNSKVVSVVRYIVSELKDEIYAEEDISLGKRLFEYLQLQKKKIAIAESFTGGRVVSEMVKNAGISDYLEEGIVSYSNESKMNRLGVKKENLAKEGAVSSIVAYEMVTGLLKTHKVDIAIATTGIAGPKSDNSLKPVGLCYIAVGTLEGVHTYKYTFGGDREEITETAKNAALFLTIKNLKRL